MTTTAPTFMGVPLAPFVSRVVVEKAPEPAPAARPARIDRVRLALALRGCLDALRDPTVLTALQTLLLLVLALALLALVLLGGSL